MADITTMIIEVVTTKGTTMIKAITANMIVVTMIDVTMIAITVATAIATTTTTDASTSWKGGDWLISFRPHYLDNLSCLVAMA